MTLREQIMGLAKNRRGLAERLAFKIWQSTVLGATQGLVEHGAPAYVLDVCRRMGFVCNLRGKVLSGNYMGKKWNVRLISK